MSLSKHLRQFADGLAPTETTKAEARRVTDKIQTLLHTHAMGVSIDRMVPLGSYAKKTSLGHNMDVDLHVFLNGESPGFRKPKRKIAKVLLRLDPSLKKGRFAITLKVDGTDVDLVLGENFKHKYPVKYDSDEENQIANVLYYLRSITDPRVDRKQPYSTSLSEYAVLFERRHSAFSHAMSRLAKFWGSKIVTEKYPKGMSSIMEYIGARAAEDEESTGSQDLLGAFRRFLNMVRLPRKLCIYWEYFYTKEDIPAKILRQRPLLLDPSNPYDNFFKPGRRVTQAFYAEMKRFAEDTINQLEDAERRGTVPNMFT